MECATLPSRGLPAQTDEHLVAATRSGQPRAFEEIVRRYRPALVRFAGRFVSDGRAEDVVQEALIRSHRALLSGESEIHLRSWLYRIVHNGAISELRATRSHDQLDEGINGVPQPPELIERREEVRGVVRRLKALPSNQRQALVASELEGASHEQIAIALGTTPGGVSQLIFRARTALRNAGAWLLPLPLMRWISKLSDTTTGGAGSAGVAGGASAAVAGSAGAKLGSAVAAAALLVGSGAAIKGEPPVSGAGTGETRAENTASSGTAAGGGTSSSDAAPSATGGAVASGGSGSAQSSGASDSARSGGGEASSAPATGQWREAPAGGQDTSGGAADDPSAPASSGQQSPPSGPPQHGSGSAPPQGQQPPGGTYPGGTGTAPQPGGSRPPQEYTQPRLYGGGGSYGAPPPPDGDAPTHGSQPAPEGGYYGGHH